jgi:hypothetical protein
MERPYSFLADCLSKFHTASEPIQALWIVATVFIILGVTWLGVRGAVEIARALRPANGKWDHIGRLAPMRADPASLKASTSVVSGIDLGNPHLDSHGAGKAWTAGSDPAMIGKTESRQR